MKTFVLPIIIILTAILSCSRQSVYPSPPLNGTDVAINISSLQTEVPKFYTYQYRDKNITFFLLKIQDKVNAYLDACASCYPHKQGYRYDDGTVTCKYCGEKFSVYRLEKGIGGCYPIKIKGRVERDEYRISLKTLEDAADKF